MAHSQSEKPASALNAGATIRAVLGWASALASSHLTEALLQGFAIACSIEVS